jgi:hypothetical protein
MTDQTPALTTCEVFIEAGRMLAFTAEKIIIKCNYFNEITELEGFYVNASHAGRSCSQHQLCQFRQLDGKLGQG